MPSTHQWQCPIVNVWRGDGLGCLPGNVWLVHCTGESRDLPIKVGLYWEDVDVHLIHYSWKTLAILKEIRSHIGWFYQTPLDPPNALIWELCLKGCVSDNDRLGGISMHEGGVVWHTEDDDDGMYITWSAIFFCMMRLEWKYGSAISLPGKIFCAGEIMWYSSCLGRKKKPLFYW